MSDSTIHWLASQTPIAADELVFYRLSDSTTYKTPTSGLPAMTATVWWMVPTPPNNTTTFLRWDGTFAIPAGSWDMVLASVQTNSWLKTFLDTTFGLRNVANTFTGLFTNVITAARTWTLPDSNTIIPIISQILTFSWPTASRTITLPDANFTVARTDAANTFTGVQTMTSPAITTPAITGLSTGSGVASAATASTLMTRDSSANSFSNNTVEGFTTTATAAGTTTMTVASTYTQVWTGSTTQTVKLGTTSVLAGHQHIIYNQSTGSVTVQSSGANTIVVLGAWMSATFTAVVNTPTTAANWNYDLSTWTDAVNSITATANAATINLAFVTNTVTNNSAATITITIPTAWAVDWEKRIVRVLDFSAVAQTLTLVNTENSSVTPNATTNGSTTLPYTFGVQYNSSTSKWRVIASA